MIKGVKKNNGKFPYVPLESAPAPQTLMTDRLFNIFIVLSFRAFYINRIF